MSRADELLAGGAREILGRPLSEREFESFQKYLHLIVKWQRVQRLVGSTDPVWIVESLFLDSLLFLKVLPEGLESIADLGSGAGLPGVPIKIVRAGLAVSLIESRERRASFLSTVIRDVGLERARVVTARAEDLGPEFVGSFGAVVMRCAGDLGLVLAAAKRLVAPGGLVVASGPPRRRPPPPGGQWVEISGPVAGRTRNFAVVRV